MSSTITYPSAGKTAEVAAVRAPYVVAAFCGEQPTLRPGRYSIAEVERVIFQRGDARHARRLGEGDPPTLELALPDPMLSSRHAALIRKRDGWHIEDCRSKNGTYLNGRRVRRSRLHDGDIVEMGGTLLLYRDEVKRLPGEPLDVDLADQPVTALSTLDVGLAREIARLKSVARSDTPILVLGASGTGKELTARAVHDLSGREGRFVAVNCGAIPESLIESELFGHRRGAFSGATADRDGVVRAAAAGTLFLDEVAELPAPSQAALLRVLQEREVVPVGGVKPIAVDIRVVAATHQDLAALQSAGQFRHDLFARLAGFTVHLPPLAERREDIGLVGSTLIRRLAGDTATTVTFARSAARALFAYPWPLNARELEHALQTALTLAEGRPIELEDFPRKIRAAVAEPTSVDDTYDSLVSLLNRRRGNISAIARELGCSRAQVHRMLKRFGLDASSYRQ